MRSSLRNLFYTTDISVTLWVVNKNKKARELRGERRYQSKLSPETADRDSLHGLDVQVGEPFEKKFIQFSESHISSIVKTYHDWQQSNNAYADVAEYCYSASLEEIRKRDYSLVPSKYIEFVNRDENVDFKEKMTALKSEFADLLAAEQKSKLALLGVFKEMGYDIEFISRLGISVHI